jgi:CRP-like cAMP-binding protein
MRQGEIPEKVYIIRDGQVRLWKYEDTGTEIKNEKTSFNIHDKKWQINRAAPAQKVRELAIVGRAQMIGEEGLFTGMKRQYTATTDTETTVYEINNERFLVICENNELIKHVMEGYIRKKIQILKILESRAIKATKKFNDLATNLLTNNLTQQQVKEALTERLPKQATVSPPDSPIKKTYIGLYSRTKLEASERVAKIKQIRTDRRVETEDIEIDKALISMKEEINKARKQKKQKLLIKKHENRISYDLNSIMSRAVLKTTEQIAERSVMAGSGRSNENSSKDRCKMFNIVKDYKALNIDLNNDLNNFRKSFNVVCQNYLAERPTPKTSKKLPLMRNNIQLSKQYPNPGYMGLHARSSSTHALITQVCLTDRQQSSVQENELSTASLSYKPAIRITSLRRLVRPQPTDI